MTKLKLSATPDEKPVKATVELPADVHRDLIDHARVLGKQTGRELAPPRLIAPMSARFMATDRGIAKARKTVDAASRQKVSGKTTEPPSDT
ncbi:DUF2274 domain-containing protein [Phaeobacter sp. C3_T13_0]|uniref:DUF2274 domain-containing protein n=1 Tax=Phaeobacter cretensis TaxID=3342641 RepID=UPI0039BC7976